MRGTALNLWRRAVSQEEGTELVKRKEVEAMWLLGQPSTQRVGNLVARPGFSVVEASNRLWWEDRAQARKA